MREEDAKSEKIFECLDFLESMNIVMYIFQKFDLNLADDYIWRETQINSDLFHCYR